MTDRTQNFDHHTPTIITDAQAAATLAHDIAALFVRFTDDMRGPLDVLIRGLDLDASKPDPGPCPGCTRLDLLETNLLLLRETARHLTDDALPKEYVVMLRDLDAVIGGIQRGTTD